MCSLIVLRGFHADHPLVIGANRDERTDRSASPPGLWVGTRHRVLSPRDRRAGGTWIAVDERGRFAAITNLKGAPMPLDAPSRGHLPHLALDQPDLDAAVLAVAARVAAEPHAGFQLALADAARIVVLRHAGGRIERLDWQERVLAISNEHGPGQLHLRRLPAALRAGLDLEQRLDALADVLRDPGDAEQHPVLKRGAGYGTLSSSLIAVPAADPTALRWRYAAGPPDVTPYRNYGNLGRRLLPG